MNHKKKWLMMFIASFFIALGGASVTVLAFSNMASASSQTEVSDIAEVTEESIQAPAAADNTIGLKSIAVGLAIGLAAGGCGAGMGVVAGKAAEGISRQPDASGPIRTTFMLGLVFIETAIIYALLVVILIIFVI